MAAKTAIMGFGNPVRSDDGVGCYVIERLRERYGDRPDLSFFDMGTAAFEVLFQLKGHDRILLVDAVINTGEIPGSLYRLPASAVESAVQDDPMVFLHALKWDQALSYARKILREEYPENIEVYLIAVDNTRLEVGLSDVVRQAADNLLALLEKEFGAVSITE